MSTSSPDAASPDAAAGMDAVEPLTLLKLRLQAARELGCEVEELDTETGYLNEIRRGDVRRVLVGGLSPLNDAVASRLVGDKFHTLNVLRRRGFKTPDTTRCLKPGHFRNEYESMTGHGPASAFAEANGYPVIVKPNSGSRGLDITCAGSEAEMRDAVDTVWKRDYLALVQEAIAGFDLRIDFLDGEYLFGYTRHPVKIVGDGHTPLRGLLAATDSRFQGASFESHLEDDPIWQTEARRRGLGLGTVLQADQVLDFDTPILNLNRLCFGRRLVELPEPWTRFGLSIGEVFALRHFGIDLKITSLDQDPADATVIEVNSSPSLAHMSRMGHFEAALDAERRIVAKILESTPQSRS